MICFLVNLYARLDDEGLSLSTGEAIHAVAGVGAAEGRTYDIVRTSIAFFCCHALTHSCIIIPYPPQGLYTPQARADERAGNATLFQPVLLRKRSDPLLSHELRAGLTNAPFFKPFGGSVPKISDANSARSG